MILTIKEFLNFLTFTHLYGGILLSIIIVGLFNDIIKSESKTDTLAVIIVFFLIVPYLIYVIYF